MVSSATQRSYSLLLMIGMGLYSCGVPPDVAVGDDDDSAVDIPDEPPTPEPPLLSWTRDIRPILGPHCNSCHGLGGWAPPWWLDSYDEVIAPTTTAMGQHYCPPKIGEGKRPSTRAECLPVMLSAGVMPVGYGTEGPAPLTEEEYNLLLDWVEAGAPE